MIYGKKIAQVAAKILWASILCFLSQKQVLFAYNLPETGYNSGLRHSLKARKKVHSSWILESSPFKSIWGQASLRLEKSISDKFSGAMMLEQYNSSGERLDFKNTHKTINIEGVSNYLNYQSVQVFFALGALGEFSVLGRQHTDSYFPYPDEIKTHSTRWVDKDFHFRAQQSIGIRFFSQSVWTASLRMNVDELLYFSHNSSIDLSKNKKISNAYDEPQKVRYQVLMFAGLYLP